MVAEGQVHLVGTGRDLLMGAGTRFDLQDDFNPFIRSQRDPQGGPRPYAHGSWVGSEWQDPVVVPLRVIANGANGDVPTTRQALMDMTAAFSAVGATGETAELRFRLEGDPEEYVMFGRPRGPEPDMSTIGLGYAYASGAFVASDPRIYSGTETTVETGMSTQTGGLIVTGVPASTRLRLTGASGSYASTPDHASLGITGDLDVRFEADLPSWASGAVQSLVSKWTATGDQRSFRLRTNATGTLTLQWTTGGVTAINATSSVAVPVTSGPLAVRATLDVDNGASQRVVTFYTAPSIAGPWTQLGTNTPTAGVTSIFSGSAVLEVGSSTLGTTDLAQGSIRAAEVRSSIAGTVVSNPDFTDHTPGGASFADSTGKTWTVNAPAKLVAGSTYRGGLTLPVTVSGRLQGGLLTLNNIGSTATWMRIRIDGPAVEPRLILRRSDGSVQSLRFSLTLAEGQWLEIDTTTRQSLLNGLPESEQRGNSTWDLDPYPLLPGVNTVRFLASVASPTAQMSVTFRSASW